MINKKKIVAIVLFIFLGLFIYTFANPGEDLKPNTPEQENNQNNNENNNEKNNNEQNNESPTQIVQRVDNAPTILIDDATIIILVGDNYDVMTGVRVIDNETLTATPSITDTSTLGVGRYQIVYTVKDRSDNTANAIRTLIVLDPNGDEDNDNFTNKEELEANTDFEDSNSYPKTVEPIIKLIGSDKIIIDQNQIYNELGFELQLDPHDKSTNNGDVVIESTIIPNILGEYSITYRVVDAFGKTATVTRTVQVVDQTPADVNVTYISNENKEIKYTNLGDRIAVRFITNEEIDIDNSTVKIAKTEARLESKSNISTNIFEYVYSIIVDKNTDEGIVEFVLDIIDLNGNKTETIAFNSKNYGSYIAKIVVDTTAPTIELNGDTNITLEAGIDTYTELKATVTDNIDGSWEVEPILIHYSKDNKFLGAVDAVDVNKVGTYKIVYRSTDKSGNKTVDKNRNDHDYVMRIVKVVDTTAPTMPTINTNGYVKGTWTNKKVVLDITTTDNNTPLSEMVFQYNTSPVIWPNAWKNIDNPYILDTDLYNNVYIRAIDKEGNISEYAPFVQVKIDKTAPVVKELYIKEEYSNSKAKHVWINISEKNKENKSMLKDDAIYTGFFKEGITPTIDDFVIGQNSVEKHDYKDNHFKENGRTIYLHTDKLNGEYYLWIMASDTAGNVTIHRLDNKQIIDNTNPTATITYSNNNGNAVTKEDVIVTLTADEAILPLKDWNKVSDTTYTKVYSINLKDSVEIEDLSGNKTIINYEVKRIDKKNPEFALIVNDQKYTKDVTYGISKTSVVDGVDFTILEDNIREIVIDGVSYNEKTAPRTISSQGIHTIRVIDKATNESTITFYIDSIAPTVDLDINYETLIDNNYYNNESMTINVIATDDNKLLYSFGNEDNYTSNSTYLVRWTSPNFNIYVKDSFGNVTVKNIGLHIDKYPMTITYTTLDGNKFVERNGGNFKDLDNVYIKANNNWKLTHAKYLWLDTNVGISIDKLLLEGNDFTNNKIVNPNTDGTYYLWVYAKDYHGNELLTVSNAFIIDNEAPIITIDSYDTNLTNQDIVVTASVNEGSLEVDNHRFTQNGSFEFVATDAAGNVSRKSVTITNIDKTLPQASISYTNEDIIIFHSDYEEDAQRVKGLENLKFNFSYSDPSGIKVAKYAEGKKDMSYFVNNGNLVTNPTIDKKSDTYTLYVEDNAGNKTVVTKTVNNIYKGKETANVGNLKITVDGINWLFGYYRNITVETLNNTSIAGFGHISSDSQYLTDLKVDNNNYGTKHTWKLDRNYDDYHTVYIKDSTGHIYTVWVEINPYN